MKQTMDRKEFLELSSTIIGGLGIHGVLGQVAGAQSFDADQLLDDSYLVKGLTGMARAGGWFDAHWGAAVLAGYYLCKENKLGTETTSAIKRQLDAMIALRESQFAPLPKQKTEEALIENVPKALAPALKDGLRAHGHAVIFASLSTKALRDVPQMSQPRLIEGLCGLSRQIARKDPEQPTNDTRYADTQAMVEATFESMARFKELLGRPSVRRPNFTHMTTHTEALLNLEHMGYRDLARAGHPGHAVHIGTPVPVFDSASHPLVPLRATLGDVMNESYWKNRQNLARWNKKWNVSTNPNGYWVAFGHLFKVLYSYHRLVRRIKDKEKVCLCSAILLERYLNLDVRGG